MLNCKRTSFLNTVNIQWIIREYIGVSKEHDSKADLTGIKTYQTSRETSDS